MTERRRAGPLLRWSVSLAVLGSLFWWLDPAAVAAEVSRLSPLWLLPALSLTVIPTALSAWRWHFTARRLGLDLTWRRALGDYYLSTFVNQVLPGGVLGDALRAHRHARVSGSAGPAWRAVIIERASGQIVVIFGTLGVLVTVEAWRDVLSAIWPGGGAWMLPGLAACFLGAVLVLVVRLWPAHWRILWGDVRGALLARRAWAFQLIASAMIVFSYVLVFALAGRGIEATVAFGLMLAAALPILLAMLVPVSVAGWGFREAAAAAVWFALGLPAEQGVAVALAYGLISLIGSLPGALVLSLRPGT